MLDLPSKAASPISVRWPRPGTGAHAARGDRGNPLYVTQLLAHLVEAGHLQRVDGRWTRATPVGELRLPESLRDVVLGRISAVGDDDTRPLGLAAIAGARFDALSSSKSTISTGASSTSSSGRPATASSSRSVGRWSTASSTPRSRRGLRRAVDAAPGSAARPPGRAARGEPRVWRGDARPPPLQSAMLGPAQQARAVRHARLAGDEADTAFEFETAAGTAWRRTPGGDRRRSDGEGVEARAGDPASTRNRPTPPASRHSAGRSSRRRGSPATKASSTYLCRPR